MSDADVEELLKLPSEERLRLVELIWGSLTAIPSTIPLSASHRAAIGRNLPRHRCDSVDILTLEEVLAEVRRGR